MKFRLSIMTAAMLLAPLGAALFVPAPVAAQSPAATGTLTAQDLAKEGLNTSADTAQLGTRRSLAVIIGDIVQAALSLIGIIFLILMIYGGIQWMVAQGSSEQIKKAQNIIKAAITGIIVVALAFAITYFIFNALGTATTAGTP